MLLVSVTAHDIDAAGTAVEADLPPTWLASELADAQLTATGPARVTARLSRSGTDIIVRGRVTADLTTPCARCTEPSAIHVDTDLTLLLRAVPKTRVEPAHAARPRAAREPKRELKEKEKEGKLAGAEKHGAPAEIEYEFTSQEADVDTYDGEAVVLDSFIREAILLEIPNFPLCSEACPGIAPALAASAPADIVDPRLAPLAALRAKLPSAPSAANEPAPKPATAPGASIPSKKKNKE